MNAPGPLHTFHAVAFVENISLRELAVSYPEAKRTPHDLSFVTPAGGTVFIYPFGVVVFYDLATDVREAELTRLYRLRPGLTSATVKEEFTVREEAGPADVVNGVLKLDKMTFERASVVALTVAQSAAMEYYDRIVDQMFAQTDKLVDRMEKVGTMPLSTRPLHRFIGAAIGTRSEVLSVLHLLDRPDELWDDPGADSIYEQLRAEFDLVDRYQALELKLRAVQEALELVLDVARDRRLLLLEASIVFLIVLEILLSLIRH
jgi:required for meiotic nuclear division protein 1